MTYIIKYLKYDLVSGGGHGMTPEYEEFNELQNLVDFVIKLKNLEQFLEVWNAEGYVDFLSTNYVIRLVNAEKQKREYDIYLQLHEKYNGAVTCKDALKCRHCLAVHTNSGDIIHKGFTIVTCPNCSHKNTIGNA